MIKDNNPQNLHENGDMMANPQTQERKTVTHPRRGQRGDSWQDHNGTRMLWPQIAGLAARDIKGIHSLGKSRLIPFGDDPTRGVDAEVGQKQAASISTLWSSTAATSARWPSCFGKRSPNKSASWPAVRSSRSTSTSLILKLPEDTGERAKTRVAGTSYEMPAVARTD